MAREFNINLNKTILNDNIQYNHNPKTDDEELNRVMRVADDVIDVFAKHKVNLEDAYWILCSLADSLYMYATTEDLEKI